MSQPRILFLTPKAPYPLTSGLAIRQFHLLRAYATIAAVDLAFFAERDSDLATVESGVGRFCDRIHAIPFPPARRLGSLGPWRGWRGLARPLLAGTLDCPELTRLIAESATSTDLIHVSRLHLVSAVEPLLSRQRRTPQLILDLDDVESSAQRRLLRFSPSQRRIHRVFRYCDLLRVYAYERRAVRRFDRVFVCSETDRARLRRPNVVVVPNGVEVPPKRPEHDPDPGALLFCGLLSYHPNEDAVRFFASTILPAIREEFPDARLMVVGRSPSPALRAMDNGVSVTIEADVPSVSDYYRKAAVAVVPLRMGGGTRIKILEAWALGVPVVSTSIGCEGLQGVAEEHLIIADRPQDFARACVALLRSPSHRQALARAGHDLALRKYRWESSITSAVRTVRDLLHLPDPTISATTTSDTCLA